MSGQGRTPRRPILQADSLVIASFHEVNMAAMSISLEHCAIALREKGEEFPNKGSPRVH